MPDVLDVVYDGQCAFCIRALTVVSRLSRRNVFRYHDANDHATVSARFPMLAGADTDAALFVVEPGRRVFRGFFGFRRMMWASPWLSPFLVLFYLPGASLVGPRLYARVASNRRRFGCSSVACVLPRTVDRRPDSRA